MKNPDLKMTPFDVAVQNSQMQMMKALVPFMAPGSQKFICTMIKFQELQNTIRYFKTNRLFVYQDEGDDGSALLSAVMEYCPEDRKGQIQSMMNLFQTMQLMKAFQAMNDSDDESGSPFDFSDFANFAGFSDMADISRDLGNLMPESPQNSGQAQSMLQSMLTPQQEEKMKEYESAFFNQ